MAESVPPIPYKTKALDENGFFTLAWNKWFAQIFTRVGGFEALTNVELEEVQTSDMDEVQADILALETLTTTHTASIATALASINGLNQGPNL